MRLFLWSGGVEDVTLPTVNAKPIPVGAQVGVTFLSDRTASGMVLGTVEGLLSWRRTAPPAFAERMQPQLQETIVRCSGLDPTPTVVENAFTLEPDDGQGLFGAAIVMADGRVFFVPGQVGAAAVIPPLSPWRRFGITGREGGGFREDPPLPGSTSCTAVHQQPDENSSPASCFSREG